MMNFKSATLAAVLMGSALSSSALTLGNARGAAWIGQPLDLVVGVQLDDAQSDSALCAEADVFHADSKQDGARVHVTTEPGGKLRIRSDVPVDEPVVTVYLRAGCGAKTTRRYVLLADYPSDVLPALPSVASEPSAAAMSASKPLWSQPAGPAAEPVPPGAATSRASAPKPAASISPRPAPRKKPDSSPAPKAVPARPVASAAASVASAAKVQTGKSTGTGRPRLQLDPLENLAQRITTLETATPVPQADAAHESQGLQQLLSEVKALKDQAVKNEVSLLMMRERLEKAESERFPATLVYALAALVALSWAVMAFLWIRRPVLPAWRTGLMDREDGRARTAGVPETAARTMHMDVNSELDTDPPVVTREVELGAELDLDLTDVEAQSLRELMRKDRPASTRGATVPMGKV